MRGSVVLSSVSWGFSTTVILSMHTRRSFILLVAGDMTPARHGDSGNVPYSEAVAHIVSICLSLPECAQLSSGAYIGVGIRFFVRNHI